MKMLTLTLEDSTPSKPGFKPAARTIFREVYHDLSAHRPPREIILEWLDSLADEVRAGAAQMQANPGTEKVLLHARLPIMNDALGCCLHQWISDIPVEGRELEILKTKVEAAYRPQIESVPQESAP